MHSSASMYPCMHPWRHISLLAPFEQHMWSCIMRMNVLPQVLVRVPHCCCACASVSGCSHIALAQGGPHRGVVWCSRWLPNLVAYMPGTLLHSSASVCVQQGVLDMVGAGSRRSFVAQVTSLLIAVCWVVVSAGGVPTHFSVPPCWDNLCHSKIWSLLQVFQAKLLF